MSRSRLQDHFVILSQKLDVEKVIPYLREERMLTADEHEQLSLPMISVRHKRERLLLLLPRKGRRHFEIFGKCLVWSGQVDLARAIGIDVDSVPPSPYGPPPQEEPQVQVDQSQLFQLIQTLITPNKDVSQSLPVSLASSTHMPQPGPNSLPGGYSGGGGVPPGGHHPSLAGGQGATGPLPSSMYPHNLHNQPPVVGGTSLVAGGTSLQQPPPPPCPLQQPLPRPPGTVPQVFVLYCKDVRVVGKSPGDFCNDVMDLADILSHTGGLKCHFDGYDMPAEQYPTNWSLWTENMIKESDFVLIVCSPSLQQLLQSQGPVEMMKGKFFANAIMNVIHTHAQKFIPVFLNEGPQAEWVPASLRMRTCYQLNVAEFHEHLGDTEGLSREEFGSRLAEVLQDLRFQNIASLLAHLRGESYNPQPQAPLNPVRLPAQPLTSGLGPTVPYPQSGGYMYHPSPTHTHLYGAANSGAEKIAEGDLLKIAERVPRDWQHLGIKLGVEYSVLENLRTTHPSDARSATMEMFGIWQRTKGKAATRKALKQALLNLKYGRVANEVFPND